MVSLYGDTFMITAALITGILTTTAPALWGGLGTVGVLILNKFVLSNKDVKVEKREDFKAITDSLLKDMTLLKEDISRYKNEADKCEEKYIELQSKFMDFKAKDNELDLRYQIQVKVNQKLESEIRHLETQITYHIDKEKKLLILNDRQDQTDNPLKGPTGN